MILCRVEGSVVATAHHPAFDGRKLLIVQPVEPSGQGVQAKGPSFLAVDDVQAGVGDLVLVMREGNGVRQLVKMGAQVPIRSLIVGVVDAVDAQGDGGVSEAALRAELVEYAHALHARGWVANHDGNLTARLPASDRFLATPTATSKAKVTTSSILTVDAGGAKVGTAGGKSFSELSLHLAVYAARPDVRAVVHAHPPHATGFAVAGRELPATFLAEAVVSIGPAIPTVPFAAPGAGAAHSLGPFVAEHDAVLLANHGVLTWGVDVEQAYLRLELVEHLARIALVAQQLGGVHPLPASVMPALAEARAKAGLGPRGRGVTPSSRTTAPAGDDRPAVIACAPGPSDAPVRVRDDKRDAGARGELSAIIREEVTRALRER